MPQDSYFSVNGLRLHFLDWPAESQSSQCCLLLHGSTGHGLIWDSLASKLSLHMRVIAPDLRGHGDSQWVRPAAYSCADYVGDIASLIDRLELDRVSIVAHSMSVFHSIRYAAENPGRVERLALIDIEATGRSEHKQILNAAGLRPQPRLESINEAVERERRTAPRAPDSLLRSFVEHNLRRRSDGVLTYKYDRATLAEFDKYDEWDNLGRVHCPAMVVYGGESLLVQTDVMAEMSRALPRGQLAAIEAAGHLPHLDNPKVFERVIIEFLLRKD